jgi:microcompartment protein CcmL/EutN
MKFENKGAYGVDALGVIEVNSVAAGIEAGDAMLKTADVSLVVAQPVCAGKYIVVVQGGVAEVKSSVNAGISISNESLVDSLVIPNIHPQVFSAIACTSEISKRDAVGIIETFSLATVITASDTALKAADINLIEIRLGRGLGGKSFVVLTGDVSAVKFAVESAVKVYENQGMIARTVVIPSPHQDIMGALL